MITRVPRPGSPAWSVMTSFTVTASAVEETSFVRNSFVKIRVLFHWVIAYYFYCNWYDVIKHHGQVVPMGLLYAYTYAHGADAAPVANLQTSINRLELFTLWRFDTRMKESAHATHASKRRWRTVCHAVNERDNVVFRCNVNYSIKR